VRVLPAASAEQSARAEAFGTVEARESAWIRAEVAGLVERVGFSDGDRVTEGQVLVQLRSADARAAVADADARLRLAVSQLGRTQGLFDRANASQADVDRAVADRDLAQAALDRAREAQRRTAVRAPFDGIAGRRMVAPGELLDTQRVITRVESIDTVTVDAAFPERFLPVLALGSEARAELEAVTGGPVTGRVVYVAPRIAEGSRTVEVRVEIPNPDHRLVPGMSARLSVGLPALAAVVTLPTQAVVTTAEGASVWVVVDGKAERREVVLGPREAANVAVVDGLQVGEPVIVEGLLRLKPGAPVSVTEDAE
jgi:membrane fusion protein (multidrug efflux system)